MERSTDKLFIYFACLALLAMRALGDADAADVAAATAAAHGGMLGIGATDVVVALAAVSAAALNEALPTRTRPLAPIALGIIAIFSPTGFLFLPLACYDAARELHRMDWLRACMPCPRSRSQRRCPARHRNCRKFPSRRLQRARRLALYAHESYACAPGNPLPDAR